MNSIAPFSIPPYVEDGSYPEAYYLQKQYYIRSQNGTGPFIGLGAKELITHLKIGGKLNPVENDVFLDYVRIHKNVEIAARLAGYKAGLQEFNSVRMLVTHDPKYVVPVRGDYHLIDRLITQMLGEEQKTVLYSWLQVAHRNLHDPEYSARGQALFFVGERRSYKTGLYALLKDFFGGRSADCYQYLMGLTTFNEHMAESELLVIDDKVGTDWEKRDNFTQMFKGLIAEDDFSLHPKGQKARKVRPKWRLLVLLNETPSALKMIPFLDETVADKLTIFKVNRPDMSDEISREVMQNEQALHELFRARLPAFIHYIANDFVIPEHLLANRFGVNHYHNFEIVNLIRQTPGDASLLDLLEHTFQTAEYPNLSYRFKASVLLHFLKRMGMTLDRSFGSSTAMGRQLTSLVTSSPDRLQGEKHPGQTCMYQLLSRAKPAELFDLEDVMQQLDQELTEPLVHNRDEVSPRRMSSDHSYRIAFKEFLEAQRICNPNKFTKVVDAIPTNIIASQAAD